MTRVQRQLDLDIARLEQREARFHLNKAKYTELNILREEYEFRAAVHAKALAYALMEVAQEASLLVKYSFRGLKLWLNS